jgi:hypothetical protein
MKQILNIFRKDARHHWIEISIFILVLAVYVWNEPSRWGPTEFEPRLRSFLSGFITVGVILAALFLIVRVIQGESLVGDRQFWITRPYDWKKLLAAKVMFLLVFIQVPMFLASVVLVVFARFPSPLSFAPDLLVAQVGAIVIALPLIALAVVTPNIAQLLLAMLFVVAFMAGGIFLSQYVPSADFSTDAGNAQIVILIAGSVAAVFYQYVKRKAFRSRLILIGSALTILAILALAPYRALINRDYPVTTNEQLPVHFALDAEKPNPNGLFRNDDIYLDLPIKFSGLQPGTVVSVDGAMLTVDPSGQSSWSSGWKSTYHRLMPNRNEFQLNFELKKSFFEKVKSQSVRAHIALALTWFRDKEIRHIMVTDGEFYIPEIGICSINNRFQARSVRCRYAVKTPTFVTTLVSSESTCPQPKPKNSEMPSPTTMYDFSGKNDGPAPLNPVDTLNLNFDSWDASDKTGLILRSVCPGTPLTLAIQEEVKKMQTRIDIDAIRLENYAPTNYLDSDSISIGIN